MDARMMLIRATYNERQRSSSIKDISIESADENGRAGAKASKVEKCDCQQGYSGMYVNVEYQAMFSNSFVSYWDMIGVNLNTQTSQRCKLSIESQLFRGIIVGITNTI